MPPTQHKLTAPVVCALGSPDLAWHAWALLERCLHTHQLHGVCRPCALNRIRMQLCEVPTGPAGSEEQPVNVLNV